MTLREELVVTLKLESAEEASLLRRLLAPKAEVGQDEALLHFRDRLREALRNTTVVDGQEREI